MSLLLKALEKSDQDKEVEEGQPSAAPAGEAAQKSASGGMKLAGSGGARPSKLGSALSKKTSEGEAAQAGRVVAAYDQGEGYDEAVVKAAARARQRNIVLMLVMLVIVGAGYYGYQTFAPQFFPQQETVVEADSGVAVTQEPTETSEVTLLPLAEPLYDIQESISLASTGIREGGTATTSAEGSELADSISQLVSDILRAEALGVEADTEILNEVTGIDDEVDPLAELLSAEFDATTATQVDTTSDMLARLEALEQSRYVAAGGDQYVKPSSVSLEELQGGETQQEASSAPKKPVVIARQDNNHGQLLKQGAESYQAGNFNAAENAFRSVIAADPRNSQALLGLAKVHQARGSNKLAIATLLKAAEYSPNDPDIVGELVAMQLNSVDPLLGESRLRSLLGRTDNPVTQSRLLFALGTLYARQQAWDQARLAFTEASALDSTNPDVAYNLAVVRDYFNDNEAALSAYRQALRLADLKPSSFDPDVVRNRISQLETK